MDLENQIEYEFKALELLKNTNRTPKLFIMMIVKNLYPLAF